MYPHERSLVKQYADQPFAILGINGGDELDLLKKLVQQKELTWRFWFDGDTSGPIHTQWRIQAWPTLILIDHEGVIRYRDLDGPLLDRAIERLVAVAKAEAKTETKTDTKADSKVEAKPETK